MGKGSAEVTDTRTACTGGEVGRANYEPALNWILLASLSLAAVLFSGIPPGERSHSPELGGRMGFLATHSKEDLHQVEFSLSHPWIGSWTGSSGWWLDARLYGSAGVLWGAEEQGAVVTLGPGLNLGKGNAPLALSVGVRPTLLSRYTFGRVHLGRKLQFTSHIGLHLHLGPRLGAGYQFQHMSNGTLSGPNPGVDMHMVGLIMRF